MSATLSPSRAAETAAHVPAIPPPTTTKSYEPPSSAVSGRPKSLRRKRAICGSLFGGDRSGSVVNRIASQRPSKPVRSWRATVVLRAAISTWPPSCQCQSAPSVPKTVGRALPLMITWNLPGPPGAFQGATQSRVRTSTRYVPARESLPPCRRRPQAHRVHGPEGRGTPSRPSTAGPPSNRPGG